MSWKNVVIAGVVLSALFCGPVQAQDFVLGNLSVTPSFAGSSWDGSASSSHVVDRLPSGYLAETSTEQPAETPAETGRGNLAVLAGLTAFLLFGCSITGLVVVRQQRRKTKSGPQTLTFAS